MLCYGEIIFFFNFQLIQRRKEGALTVPYRVIDNPGKLTNADWDRVRFSNDHRTQFPF